MKQSINKLEITIASSTLLKIVLLVGGVWFLFTIRNILLIVFLAFIIMSSILPLVRILEEKKVPKTAAVVVIYVSLLGIIFLLGYLVLSPLLIQLSEFLTRLPEYVEMLVQKITPLREWYSKNDIDEAITLISSELAKQSIGLSGSIVTFFQQAWGVIGTLFGIFSMFILSLYMVIYHDENVTAILRTFNMKDLERAKRVILNVEDQLGNWVRGQFILSLIIGSVVFITLSLFRMDFALPLAIIAGALESIPNLGPVISLVPAWLLAVASGNFVQIIGLPIAYWLIQQVENNYIVPQVMQKAVGLNPVITMVSFLIGAEIAGVAGAIIAVPCAAVVQILIREVRS